MCNRSDFPPYDPPISEAQREALATLHRADAYERRIRLRARNLQAIGFTEPEAYRLARASWRVPREDSAA
jgi:hypothetical protein